MLDDTTERLLDEQGRRELFRRLCESGDRVWNAVRGSPDDLRELGLQVAVHNDSRLNGERYTFWLMTYTPPGDYRRATYAFRGEGKTDREALDQIRARFAELTDNRHHAPLCAANHFHGRRAPTGPCSCGAEEAGYDMKHRPDGFIGQLVRPLKEQP